MGKFVDFFKNLFKFSVDPTELIFRTVVIFALKIVGVAILAGLGIWAIWAIL